MRRAVFCLVALTTGIPMQHCAGDPAGQVRQAMADYDHLVLTMDANAIADLYVPDGEMRHDGNVTAQGRDAIRTLLASFDGHVKVDSNHSTIESIALKDGGATATGRFEQRAITLPDNKVLNLAGRFEAEWIKSDDSHWHLVRMSTFSSSANQ